MGIRIPKKKNGSENVFSDVKGTKKKEKKKNASAKVNWMRGGEHACTSVREML